MLRLGRERDELGVMMDQHGGPTWAGAIAATLPKIVKRWGDGELIPWGTYHYSGQPVTNWQFFAETIFEQAEKLGMIDKRSRIEPITTAEYPTLEKSPLNSVFDCHNIAREQGIPPPDWRIGLTNGLKN